MINNKVVETKVTSFLGDKLSQSEPGKIVCKFVLVAHKNELNLVIGSLEEYPYHANLLNRYCDENEVPSQWERRPDCLQLLTEDYVVKGGGWLEIDPPTRSLKFFGASTAYGPFISTDLSSVLTSNSFFSGFRTMISHQ